MGWGILWIMFGVVCAIAASSKNRNAVGWFFMGVVFGPFALLMLVFLSKLPEQVVTPTGVVIRQDDTRTCPFCAETIKAAAIVCKHCGRDIQQPCKEISHHQENGNS